jgi:Bacteriophage T4-like portal protein (Gp20)
MAQQPQNFFQKSFNNFVNKMPYNGNSTVIDNISELNPKFETFWKIGTTQQERNLRQAVSVVQDPKDPASNLNGVIVDKGYHDYLYALIDTDKAKRVADYRIMASYAEISHALDEICDEFLVKDDRGHYATLYTNEKMDNVQKKELQKEFQHVIELFNLDNRGWEYFRTLLIDAEVFFENVINEDNKEAGIISLVQIPTEHINPIFDNVQNMIIKGYILRKPVPKDENTGGFNVNNKGPSGGPKKDGMELIPLERHQVTYFHSHTWNESKTIRLPYLEVARRAYKQLSLIEDSIVVYRLVRAPERLAFYVDVGNMPAAKAEAYLKRLMQNYWSKRTYDSSQGGNVNVYDPQSMLDSYWFARRNGQDGTKVETLKGGDNLGKLEDLNYFVTKLYKALRVPSSRLMPDTKFADGAEIFREELKFAKLIIRMQRHFASTIKETFVTHLKLKGLWKDYKLRDNDIAVMFNPPSQFSAMRDQQLTELKFKNFGAATQAQNTISISYALKKYMNWNDDEILANREWLKKDAAFNWEVTQITNLGKNWKEALTQGGGGGEAGAAPMGGGGGIGPGAGSAPSFGPGPTGGPEAGGPEAAGGGAEAGGAPAAGPTPVGGGSALPKA